MLDAGTAEILEQVIPTALSNDRFGPMALGERGEALRHSPEFVPSITTRFKDRLVSVLHTMAEIVAAQELPDVLYWVQFWRIGG